MPKISVTRKLLRELPFMKVRLINSFFGLQPRHGKQDMIGQIVRCVGPTLNTLVSVNGPFSLVEWNEIAVEIGGAPRKSFESIGDEIEGCLDPVFDDLDGDTSIADIRGDNFSLRSLAGKLGIDRAELDDLLFNTNGHTKLSTFVVKFREEQNEATTSVAKALGVMRLASTTAVSDSIERLTESWMIKQMAGADHIAIAAGFYDCEFLLNLLNRHRTVKSIRLLFNGLGGQRLAAQQTELQKLERQLRKEDRKVEVRLAFSAGLFHSKLFLITKNGSTLGLIGSANATCAAFERNEEILIALDDAKTLSDYFDVVWHGKRARKLDDLETAAKSLIAFFRTGVLYFKPLVSLSVTINPFREVLKSLTNEERALIGGKNLPYADQEDGIGAFNLRLAVMGSIENTDDSDNESEGSDSKESKASIKPYSVETCFGYWVPSALDGLWSATLEKAGRKKRQRWKDFLQKLNDMPEEELTKKYQDYVAAVKEVLAALPRPPTFSLDNSILNKFVGRIVLCLEDERRLDKLVLPFTSGAIPEIWDDAPAYEDFRTTFFDYLSQIARTGSKQWKVSSAILKQLKIDESPDGDKLLNQFEDYLHEYGWTDDDWK